MTEKAKTVVNAKEEKSESKIKAGIKKEDTKEKTVVNAKEEKSESKIKAGIKKEDTKEKSIQSPFKEKFKKASESLLWYTGVMATGIISSLSSLLIYDWIKKQTGNEDGNTDSI